MAVNLAVKVTPRSRVDALVGWISSADASYSASADDKGELLVKVQAVAEDGKANAAVQKLIAKSLGVAKSAVVITRGHSSRHKLLTIEVEPLSYKHWLNEIQQQPML
ncbi:MAG: DUF167 domain-containing protein [Coriobacteriales bacterium]|jgi:uncharacterized protein YggU (UPF0235/DUF167 family)|nr:DUF167 domain-containing protein [Coriobacteriales bacterium]